MSFFLRSMFVYSGLFLIVAMAGCDKEKAANDAPTSGEATGNVMAGGMGATGGASSPVSAVQAFVEAATAKDADKLAECIHATCTDEFKPLLDKSADSAMLDQLAEKFKGARVVNAKVDGDKAVISVRLTSGDEELSMARSETGWQLVDF